LAEQTETTPTHTFPRAIGNPATQALILAGYTSVEALDGASEKKILALHGVGPKAVRILKEHLAEKGLAFAP
jgi:hypothetical protein